MKQIPFHNDSDKDRYFGGRCVPAGETRVLDENLIPSNQHHTAKQKEKPANEAPQLSEIEKLAQAIVGKKVPEVVAEIPSLSDEMLALVEQAENKSPRKGIINVLAEEKLIRAQRLDAVKEILVQDSVAIIETLEALDLNEMNSLEAVEKVQATPRTDLLTAIEADRLRRADVGGGE